MDGKQDDQNLLMIDQTGYTPQFTVEQLQLLSQLQVIIKSNKLKLNRNKKNYIFSNNTLSCKLIHRLLKIYSCPRVQDFKCHLLIL